MVSAEHFHFGGIMSINVSVTYMNYMPKNCVLNHSSWHAVSAQLMNLENSWEEKVLNITDWFSHQVTTCVVYERAQKATFSEKQASEIYFKAREKKFSW